MSGTMSDSSSASSEPVVVAVVTNDRVAVEGSGGREVATTDNNAAAAAAAAAARSSKGAYDGEEGTDGTKHVAPEVDSETAGRTIDLVDSDATETDESTAKERRTSESAAGGSGKSPTSTSASEFTPKSDGRQKSQDSSHVTPRRRTMSKAPVYNDDASFSSLETTSNSGSAYESDGTEEEKLKIDRIIASRKETIGRWREICGKINTFEIENGSRWFQDTSGLNEEDEEERFLVKWKDLSYLHCSWETERDLMSQLERPKPYFTTFNRKNVDGFVFGEDERGDGEYYDANMIKIERIMKITRPSELAEPVTGGNTGKVSGSTYGVILDRKDPRYEEGTGRQFLVKWGNTAYSDSTSECERDLILNDVEYEEQVDAFLRRSRKPTKEEVETAAKKREEQSRRLYKFFGDKAVLTARSKESFVDEYKKRLEDQEFGRNGCKLRDYQAEGVSWLISNYINNRSSILSDEMGLGKTCQLSAFLHTLATESAIRGPFLVVVPLSTVSHWQRELENWTGLNAVVYHGSAEDRAVIREYEMAFESDRPPAGSASTNNYLRRCLPNKSRGRKAAAKWQRTWMVQVVITTPEMLVAEDFAELTAINWEVLVVDEAHRMKNHESKVAVNIREGKFTFGQKVLMTGTPIQNNMQELWTILHMTDPEHFDDSDRFLEKYGEMKNKEVIDELHSKIRPYVLRRLKEDVETSVPPKEETVIEVELTVLQKQYYRALYEKNVQFLHKGRKKSFDKPSLSNLGMQLRKCCNHPFLLNGVENELKKSDTSSSHSEGDFLVKASGKLVLLDKLLPKLKKDGHRVLVFSQFKIMLDILEDYFRLREMKYERIDGSITGHKRQMAIDRFQSDDESEGREKPFVMMLSTRAGGVGINLTKADTCIIFDSDWNPQNDLQAQSRCHRIGQTKHVKVYRLLARKSFEMRMFHMSSLKMGLDQAVLQGLESGSFGGDTAMTKDEVEKLLRHGAYDLFNEEKTGSSETESKRFEAQSIDEILAQRAETVVYQNTGSKSNAAGGTFSKASFTAVHDNADREGNVDDVDIDDPNFWRKVVGEGMTEASVEDLSGKKRKRQTSYSHFFSQYGAAKNAKQHHSDSDSSADIDDSGDDELVEDGPIDLTELSGDTKHAKPATPSASIRQSAESAGKMQRRDPPTSTVGGEKFIQLRGVQIPYEDRRSIAIHKYGPRFVVLSAIKALLAGDEITGVNGMSITGQDTAWVKNLICSSARGSDISIDIRRRVPPAGVGTIPLQGAPQLSRTVQREGSCPMPRPIQNLGSFSTGSSSPVKPTESPEGLKVIEVTLVRDALHHPKFGMSVASNGGKHVVDHVEEGSAAAAARTLKPGDEILVVNNRLAVGVDWRDVFREIKANEIGQPLRLRVLRRPSHHSPYAVGGSGGFLYRYGHIIRNISIQRDRTGRFGIDMQFVKDSVAVVVEIKSGTPAKRAGILKVFDEIISVNGKPLAGLGWTFAEIMNEMKATKAGHALLLDIFRPLQPPLLGPLECPATINSNIGASPSESAKDTDQKVASTKKSASSSAVRVSSEVSPSQERKRKRNEASADSVIHGRHIKGIEISRQTGTPVGMQLGFTNELAYVQAIVDGSPAALEGTVEVGDYIVTVNGQSMKASGLTLSDVTGAIKVTTPNKKLIVDILRPAAERSDGGDISTLIRGISIPRRSGEESFGIVLQRCDESSEGDNGDLSRSKVFVNDIIPGSAADREGSVQQLDVLLSVNGVDLVNASCTFQDVLEIIYETTRGQPLVLDIWRPTEKEKNTHLQLESEEEGHGTGQAAEGESSSSQRTEIERPSASAATSRGKLESEAPRSIVRGISIERDGTSLGISLYSVDGKAVVQEITTDGAAFREGSLKVGDEVIAVNGRSVIEPAMGIKEIVRLCFSTTAGKPTVLDVSRPAAQENAQVSRQAEDVSPEKRPPGTHTSSPPKRTNIVASRPEVDVVQAAQGRNDTSVASADKAGAEEKNLAGQTRTSPKTKAGSTGSIDTDTTPVAAQGCETVSPRTPVANPRDGVLGNEGDLAGKEEPHGKNERIGRKKAPPSNEKSTGTPKSNDSLSKSVSPSKRKTRTPSPGRKKPRKAVCLADSCEKGPQYGAEGFCIRHWTLQIREKAANNGREYIDQRVAKKFVDGVYYGAISSYDMSAGDDEEEGPLWHVVYDDGDEEDYSIVELREALLLYNRTKRKDTKATRS